MEFGGRGGGRKGEEGVDGMDGHQNFSTRRFYGHLNIPTFKTVFGSPYVSNWGPRKTAASLLGLVPSRLPMRLLPFEDTCCAKMNWLNYLQPGRPQYCQDHCSQAAPRRAKTGRREEEAPLRVPVSKARYEQTSTTAVPTSIDGLALGSRNLTCKKSNSSRSRRLEPFRRILETYQLQLL